MTDAAGNPLPANNVLTTFVLTADANRSKTVDSVDFNILTANFGKTGQNFGQGNFDYSANGSIDSVDFNLLASKFNVTLPAPASAARPLGLATVPEATTSDSILTQGKQILKLSRVNC